MLFSHTFVCLNLVCVLSMSTRIKTSFQKGLSASMIANIDAFVIDQWGVLHDGKVLYEGALGAMTKLTEAGKKTVMLSNSSKRKDASIAGLKKVGLDPSIFFHEIVTSGELGWQYIKERQVKELMNSGVADGSSFKVVCFGNSQDDDEYLNSAGCVVSTPEEADFILARGTGCVQVKDGTVAFEDAFDLLLSDELKVILEECAKRKLPMLVTNPDFYRPGSGQPMPGLIAKKYAELIGSSDRIKYFGKPYDDVYQACFESLGVGDKSRIAGIGDSLDHDIMGASLSGINSIFVENGVHCQQLGTEEGSQTSSGLTKVSELIAVVGEESGKPAALCEPTYSIPCFRWVEE